MLKHLNIIVASINMIVLRDRIQCWDPKNWSSFRSLGYKDWCAWTSAFRGQWRGVGWGLDETMLYVGGYWNGSGLMGVAWVFKYWEYGFLGVCCVLGILGGG